VSDGDQRSPLDAWVERLAGLMNGLGLNGTRLLWKWNNRHRERGEADLKREMFWRSAKARHKMCPECRLLVDRSASVCPDCGTSMAGVQAPGVGRALSNLLPGISAATSILMLINGLWFVLMFMAQMKSGQGVSPFGGFSPELMVGFGSGLSRAVELSSGAIAGGESWRLITAMFLHGGLIHFLFNTYLLLNLGPIVEGIYGTPRFWVIYLACGLVGNMASQLPRFTHTVGASGAIMGLIGLLLVYGYRSGGLLGQSMKQLIIRLAIYSVIMSFMFNIDHINHIAGFLCGCLMAVIMPHHPYRSVNESRFWQLLSFAGVILVLWAFYSVAAFGRATAAG
jgi:rhomboid protease GluP